MALCGSWSYSSPPILPSKSQSVNLWAHRNREPPKTWIRLRETNPRHSRAYGTHKQDTEYLALRARFVPQNPSPLEWASVPFVASAAWSRADQNPPLASTRTACLDDDENDNDDNSDDDRRQVMIVAVVVTHHPKFLQRSTVALLLKLQAGALGASLVSRQFPNVSHSSAAGTAIALGSSDCTT